MPCHQTDLCEIVLRRCRVLLLGNRGEALENLLRARGSSGIVGHAAVDRVASVPSRMERIEGCEFDVAWVAAGIAACRICPALAAQGKVAIDVGH